MFSGDESFQDTPLLPIKDTPRKIDVQIECPKYIRFPNNSVNIKAICSSELPTGVVYTYNWELKRSTLLNETHRKHDDSGTLIHASSENSTWHLPNLEEGRYIYQVAVTSSYPDSRGSKGETSGTLNVFSG